MRKTRINKRKNHTLLSIGNSLRTKLWRLQLRASPRALLSWVSYLKIEKEDKKTLIQQKLYLPRLLSLFSIQASIFVFYSRGAAGHICIALNASNPFWILEKLLDFILHNSYIRILAIHRYQSSRRCSNMAQQSTLITILMGMPKYDENISREFWSALIYISIWET